MKPASFRIPEFRRWPEVAVPQADPAGLADFLQRHPRCLFLTGAGCSTASGIPAYRDGDGRWTCRQPIQYQDFLDSLTTRRRYWARSYLGWPRMREALPNPAHRALASLKAWGIGDSLVTQNVDALHQRAGSRGVIELHGSLDQVVCQHCGHRQPRARVQTQLKRLNPSWQATVSGINPDGDAELAEPAYEGFAVPDCGQCDGVIKPDVVFFGENVPRQRVGRVRAALRDCDALVVVGSSLVVWSGYRFVREAAALDRPVVAVNQGRTRADALLDFKVEGPCDEVLGAVVTRLGLADNNA